MVKNIVSIVLQIPFLGGLCLLGYSIYSAAKGNYEYLLDYIMPLLVPFFIVGLTYYLNPEIFEQAREDINKVSKKYEMGKKIEYVRDNPQKWIVQYQKNKQRFIILVIVTFILFILIKGVFAG